MGYCSCGNWVDEGGICEHCGSAMTYDDADEEKYREAFDYFEYYYRQAKTSSIKGDHSTAIKFYKEALTSTYINHEKWEALSAIAGEYEELEDYGMAETYWNKCREFEDACGSDTAPGRIAKRGDFLYRRSRYEEAVATYEKALKALRVLEDKRISLENLMICARIGPCIIYSSLMLMIDNPSEKYNNELRHAIDSFISTEKHADNEETAYYLSKAAWELYADEDIVDEALILIDSAIKLHPNCPANYYNRKAIMLEENKEYDEALKYYDKALSKDRSNETFLNNKAGCIREKLRDKTFYNKAEPQDLDLINEALKILPDGYDNRPYLFTKSEILNQLGEPVEAKFCSAISAKDYEEVDKAEKQLKKLKSSQTYINITGVHNYQHFEPFKEGTIVDLIKEPDNPHDRHAIRVEINGQTVGYVANSKHTLIKEVKSATDIKNTKSTQAEVQFILFNEWVIAKLI